MTQRWWCPVCNAHVQVTGSKIDPPVCHFGHEPREMTPDPVTEAQSEIGGAKEQAKDW